MLEVFCLSQNEKTCKYVNLVKSMKTSRIRVTSAEL